MNNDLYFLPIEHRPIWLHYPDSLRRIVEQSLIHLTPWHIMEASRAEVHYNGLRERYPNREIFPFAFRQDNDDVACFSKDAGEKVFIIHDFASPGWEGETCYEDVWSWFKDAVEETILWE